MKSITIYPDKKLLDKIIDEARTQKRSMNNLLLLIIGDYFNIVKEEEKLR